jgi:peptide/nickel transport system permease protein
MGIRIIKRIFTYILVLFGLSVLVFIIVRVMPGDVARLALGPRAPEATVEALREQMHLNDSLFTQYFYWLGGVFKGDLGISIISKRPVLVDIVTYLPATMELVLLSVVFTVIFGIVLGVVSAKYSGKWPDAIIRIFSYFGIVAPAFLWAVLAMLVFAFLIPILPSNGRISAGMAAPPHFTGLYILDYLMSGNIEGALDALKHILMPAVVLSFAGVSQAARITRTSMTENMSRPFTAAERAYGIPENKILFKYLLRMSLNSTISVMAIDIAGAFGGAFIVEQIFNYPGLSRYSLQAVLNKDVFTVSAVVLIFGAIFIIMNLITDIIISILDPRVRLAAREET